MNCTKDFSIFVVGGSCLGLDTDAVWQAPLAPPDPPAILTSSFQGYHGTWQCISTGPSGGGPQAWEFRVDWTGVAGKTLTARATMVGSVTPLGVPFNVRIQIRTRNLGFDEDAVVIPASVPSPVNLEAFQSQPAASAAEFVQVTCILPANIFSLSGVVEIECV